MRTHPQAKMRQPSDSSHSSRRKRRRCSCILYLSSALFLLVVYLPPSTLASSLSRSSSSINNLLNAPTTNIAAAAAAPAAGTTKSRRANGWWWRHVRGGAKGKRKDAEEETEAVAKAAADEEQEETEEETPFLSFPSSSSSPTTSSSSLSPHEEAIRRAQVEMAVEDHNGLLKLEGGGVFGEKPGHFIVMPMTELFDPPLGSILHDKLQYSDKIMLPKSFIYEVLGRKLEPPWHFEITPLDDRYTSAPSPRQAAALRAWRRERSIPCLHCSNFDFRAPEHYIFIPDWMMKALRLRPRDVVSMRFVRLPEGGLVSLQPHQAAFNKLSNVHAVLEQELKYYSCVTQGTTIRFKHNGKEYALDVVETLGPKDVKVPAIKVQDSDIRTDIRPSKEEEEKRKRKQAAATAAQKAREEEEGPEEEE